MTTVWLVIALAALVVAVVSHAARNRGNQGVAEEQMSTIWLVVALAALIVAVVSQWGRF